MTTPLWLLARDDWGEDATVIPSSTLAGTDEDWVQTIQPLDAWIPDTTGDIAALGFSRTGERRVRAFFCEYTTDSGLLSFVPRVERVTGLEPVAEYAYALNRNTGISNAGLSTSGTWTLVFDIRMVGETNNPGGNAFDGDFIQAVFSRSGGIDRFVIALGDETVDISVPMMSPVKLAITGGAAVLTRVYHEGTIVGLLPSIDASAAEDIDPFLISAIGPLHLWHRTLSDSEIARATGTAVLDSDLLADAVLSFPMTDKTLTNRGTLAFAPSSSAGEFVGRLPLYPSSGSGRGRIATFGTKIRLSDGSLSSDTAGTEEAGIEFIRGSAGSGAFPLAVSRVMLADAHEFSRRPVAGNSRGTLVTEIPSTRGRSGLRVPARSRFQRNLPVTVRSGIPGELGTNIAELAATVGTNRDVFLALDPRPGPLQSQQTFRGTFASVALKEWNGQVEEATFAIEGL